MLRVLMASLAVTASGCSGLIDQFPTTPDPVITTETFSGTVNVNGSATHNVFTGATGRVVARLTSLGEVPPPRVGFSMGTLGLTGVCNVILRKDDAVVNTELNGTLNNLQGSLCVSVYDTGALAGSTDYTFTVSHP